MSWNEIKDIWNYSNNLICEIHLIEKKFNKTYYIGIDGPKN
jgi:hypothetical protein